MNIEFLRDPIWQSLGVISSVVFGGLALGAMFWIYWQQRQIKELAFGTLVSRPLVSISDEIFPRIVVSLDGKPVRNVHLLMFALRNSGYRAIKASDFQRPLSLTFPDAQIISAEISSQSPGNLDAHIGIVGSQVQLQPLLLNSGDQLIFQVLLSAGDPTPSIDARVLDVPSLVPINLNTGLPPFFKSMAPLMMGAFLLFGALLLLFGNEAYGYGYLLMALFVPVVNLIHRWHLNRLSRRRITDI